MKPSIFIRFTEDWERLDMSKYLHAISHEGKLKGRSDIERKNYVKSVKKWNEVSKIDFLSYRGFLKSTSLKYLAKTGFKIRFQPPLRGQIVIPSDDDDILHPDIAELILPYFNDSKIKAVYWDCCKYVLNRGNGKIVSFNDPKRRGLDRFGTNAAAVRAPIPSYGHGGVLQFLNRLKKHEKVHIPRPLTLWVRHEVSIQKMLNAKAFIVPDKDTPDIPSEVDWASDYINELYRFTKDALQ